MSDQEKPVANDEATLKDGAETALRQFYAIEHALDPVHTFENVLKRVPGLLDLTPKDLIKPKAKKTHALMMLSSVATELKFTHSTPDWTTSNPDEYFDERSKRFLHGPLATEIVRRGDFVTFGDMGNEMRWFDEKVWQKGGEAQVTIIARALLKGRIDEVTTSGMKELIFHVQVLTLTLYEEWKQQDDNELLPLNNGVLDIRTKELRPYHPDEHHFLGVIPVDYDPTAECPHFDNFLNETLYKADVMIIKEMFGFCLWRDYTYKKAFMLTNTGDNGKSILLEVLEQFLGKENTSSVTLSALSDSRFAAAQLRGKLANVCADLPDRAVKETGMFKMLTGHDTVPFEQKFKEAGSFYNYATLIFSANKIPDARDDTEAFYTRWIIIEFPYTFVSKSPDRLLPHEKVARNRTELIAEMTTAEELSGILNAALEALARLHSQNGFSTAVTAEELKRDYIRKSNSLKAFLGEECVIRAGLEVAAEAFYQAYMRYCEKYNMAKKDVSTVGREMRQYPDITKARARVDGQRTYVWSGMSPTALLNDETAEEVGASTSPDITKFEEPPQHAEVQKAPEPEPETKEPSHAAPEKADESWKAEFNAKQEINGKLDALTNDFDQEIVKSCVNVLLEGLKTGDPLSAFHLRRVVPKEFPDQAEKVEELINGHFGDLDAIAKQIHKARKPQ